MGPIDVSSAAGGRASGTARLDTIGARCDPSRAMGFGQAARSLLLGARTAAVLLSAGPASAGTWGVPTDVSYSDGTTSGCTSTSTAACPPGWFVLTGFTPGSGGDTDADSVHQIRLFIEVTGTSLDVLVFDPGTKDHRDLDGDGNGRTEYVLYAPDGTVVASETDLNDDGGSTQNRLARFGTDGKFRKLDDTNASNQGFTVSPGRYELRVTFRHKDGGTNNTNEANVFGVDIRAGKVNSGGTTAHYNVYTVGTNSGTASSMVVGANDCSKVGNCTEGAGQPHALVANPMALHAYVPSGCSFQTSNYDMDADTSTGSGGSGTITDVLGASTSLGMSGSGSGGSSTAAHLENTVVSEDPGAANTDSRNYGMYALSTSTGSQTNAVDWRLADFQGWSTNPTNAPRTPVNALRTYLPNGYGTAPREPTLSSFVNWSSGPNPPVAGQTTRLVLTAYVSNLGPTAITDVAVTIPIVADAAYVSSSQTAYLDGSTTTCTDGSSGSYRRCTFASVPAGSIATLAIEVDYTPSSSGLRQVTGAPVSGAAPNTAVWAEYEPGHASTSRPTEMLGPICQLVLDVGTTVVPTPAVLRGLRVDPAGVVEFAVGGQADSAAFDLFEVEAPDGAPNPVPLNREPVRVRQRSRVGPALYRVETRPVTAPYVSISEVDGRGRRRLLGPFAVDDARLREAFEAVERMLDAAGAPRLPRGERAARDGARAAAQGPRRGPPAAPRHGSGSALKILVQGAGEVRVPERELAAWGLPPGLAERRLRLSNLGRDVPFRVESERGARVLAFTARPLVTAYTDRNPYVLSWDRSLPSPPVGLTRWETAATAGVTRVEKDLVYSNNVPLDTSTWLWDALFGDGSPWPYPWQADAGTFDLPGLVPPAGDVTAALRLLGRTGHTHTVEATLNGVALGTLVIPGAVAAELKARVPGTALAAGGNVLELRYASAPDPWGYVLLDRLDLSLPLPSPPPSYALAAFAPAVVPPGTDYLVLTHAALREAAGDLAELKAAEGLHPAVVDVEGAYDGFAAGVTEPNAVRALIASASRTRPLRYVLLLGDDSHDPLDRAGAGTAAFVPSLQAWDGEFGRVPSENLYADVDFDGRPDVAIGRLPAQTAEEAAAMVRKVARQAAVLGARAGHHLFAVDNPSPGDPDFRGLAGAAAGLLPRGRQLEWADLALGPSPARDALLGALPRSGFVHYFGHGGLQVWADEGLLSVEDAAGLSAASGEAVFLQWACLTQWYPFRVQSLGEVLLQQPEGGALATFGPAGMTAPDVQAPLVRSLYARLFAGGGTTLGEAIRQAKREALDGDPASRRAVEGFNLLGDPALRVP